MEWISVGHWHMATISKSTLKMKSPGSKYKKINHYIGHWKLNDMQCWFFWLYVLPEMSMDWIRPWIGFDWIGSDWIGLNSAWIGLDWVRWLLCTKFWQSVFFSETDQDCSM